MGIRERLLFLAVVVAVPLALVGVADMRGIWQSNRSQLDEALRQQAELAAVAFERWIDAQRQPLMTLAAEAGEQSLRSPQLAAHLRLTAQTRPYWIDARFIDQAGDTLAAHPPGVEPPPPALTDYLLSEIRRHGSWAIATDRTFDEARPVFALAAPAGGEGAVMARVDGEAISDLFRDIEMPERAVIAVFDSQSRRLYRRRTTQEPVDLSISGAPLIAALGGGVIDTYIGKDAGAPAPVAVLGTEIEAKPDGSMYQMIQYPQAGYWVAYSRTPGDSPMVIITMQKSH